MSLLAIVHAIFYLFYTVFRIPTWSLVYLYPSFRPHARWTWRQALRVRLFRSFIYIIGLTRLAPPLSLKPGKEGDRFVVMQPAEKTMYRGVANCDENIEPVEVGGTWYPNLPQGGSGTESTSWSTTSTNPLGTKSLQGRNAIKKTKGGSSTVGEVVLHFHGGGYTLGDGRVADCGFAASTILDRTPPSLTHVFCPQYRLSSTPGHRFPAAFQDALTSYLYLTNTLKIPAKKIVLSGDSAGGHMVIQLLRYISEYRTELGVKNPKAAWLWSPWCDVKSAVTDPTIVYRTPQYPTDFLPSHHLLSWAADTYAPRPSTGVTLDDPYVSPLGHPFELPCPTFAMIGGVELNVTEVTTWRKEMRGLSEKNEIELYVEEDAPHDVLKCGGLLGFEVEAERSVRRATEFTWA